MPRRNPSRCRRAHARGRREERRPARRRRRAPRLRADVALRGTPTAASPAAANPSNNPTIPVSARNCTPTLWGSDVTIEPTRIGRRAISNVCAPVPPSGSSRNSAHASCHHVHRLFELISPRRPDPCTTSPLPRNSSNHVPGPLAASDAATTPTAAATRMAAPRRFAHCVRSPAERRSPRRAPSCASPSAAPAPRASASANHAPARSRAAVDWRSPTSPSWVDAHTATATAGALPATSITTPSNRSAQSTSQRQTPSVATMIPAREYVSTRPISAM